MKKIGVITTTRADYGILRNLIKKINVSDNLELQLIISGTHLIVPFGYTKKEIMADGFENTIDMDIMLYNDSPDAISKTMGITAISFSTILNKINLDAILILGDRFELMPICSTALVYNIPIIHICGGEVTNGAIDDSIRHAITKMSFLHFVSCEEYRNRVIQLGENPTRVFNYGDLSVENILHTDFLNRKLLCEYLKVDPSKELVCATIHPETAKKTCIDAQCKAILDVVRHYSNFQFVFTKANADYGGEHINRILYEHSHKIQNLHLFDSLGSLRYLSLIKHSAFVLGNSSSGIVEAPALGIPTINVGSRQDGRLKAESIIDVAFDSREIEKAIEKINDEEFKQKIASMTPIFSGHNTAKNIVAKIEETLESYSTFNKEFYDIK